MVCEAGSIHTPILQMREVRLKEAGLTPQLHIYQMVELRFTLCLMLAPVFLSTLFKAIRQRVNKSYFHIKKYK